MLLSKSCLYLRMRPEQGAQDLVFLDALHQQIHLADTIHSASKLSGHVGKVIQHKRDEVFISPKHGREEFPKLSPMDGDRHGRMLCQSRDKDNEGPVPIAHPPRNSARHSAAD